MSKRLSNRTRSQSVPAPKTPNRVQEEAPRKMLPAFLRGVTTSMEFLDKIGSLDFKPEKASKPKLRNEAAQPERNSRNCIATIADSVASSITQHIPEVPGIVRTVFSGSVDIAETVLSIGQAPARRQRAKHVQGQEPQAQKKKPQKREDQLIATDNVAKGSETSQQTICSTVKGTNEKVDVVCDKTKSNASKEMVESEDRIDQKSDEAGTIHTQQPKAPVTASSSFENLGAKDSLHGLNLQLLPVPSLHLLPNVDHISSELDVDLAMQQAQNVSAKEKKEQEMAAKPMEEDEDDQEPANTKPPGLSPAEEKLHDQMYEMEKIWKSVANDVVRPLMNKELASEVSKLKLKGDHGDADFQKVEEICVIYLLKSLNVDKDAYLVIQNPGSRLLEQLSSSFPMAKIRYFGAVKNVSLPNVIHRSTDFVSDVYFKSLKGKSVAFIGCGLRGDDGDFAAYVLKRAGGIVSCLVLFPTETIAAKVALAKVDSLSIGPKLYSSSCGFSSIKQVSAITGISFTTLVKNDRFVKTNKMAQAVANVYRVTTLEKMGYDVNLFALPLELYPEVIMTATRSSSRLGSRVGNCNI